MMSLVALSTSTDVQIGDNPGYPVVSIGLDIEYQGSSISLSYARSELPHGTIYFGRSPSLSEPTDSTDLGGRLNGATGRVEFRCAVMSREHASLTFENDGNVYLRDLPACHHGTTITRGNSEIRLDKIQPYQLFDGDKITFGKPVHKGGVVHEPLHATVRLSKTPEKPHVGFGRYRLSSPDLYTDDDFGREVTPPWRKDFGDLTTMLCGFGGDLNSHQSYSAQLAYDISDEDEDDEDDDDDSVVEFVPPCAPANPSPSHSSTSTATKSPVQAEVIDLTRELSPVRSPCFEVVEDSEVEEASSAAMRAFASLVSVQEEALPLPSDMELESPQPVRKPDIEHLLNDGVDEPRDINEYIAENQPESSVAKIAQLQGALADIKREMQECRGHRLQSECLLTFNQTTIEASIQNIAGKLQTFEERLDSSLFADSQINDEVDIALSAVADLANDVEDGRNEIIDMLAEIRDLRAECARMMKAEVENVVSKTSELTLKRKHAELESSDRDEESPFTTLQLSAVQPSSASDSLINSVSETPSTKRRKILPSFGGSSISHFVLGAIAGSIGTVMALAFTDDE